MIPHHFIGQERILNPPPNYDGECAQLPVAYLRDNAGNAIGCISCWRPTPVELAILNAGGAVELIVVGPQQPAALGVREAAALIMPASMENAAGKTS